LKKVYVVWGKAKKPLYPRSQYQETTLDYPRSQSGSGFSTYFLRNDFLDLLASFSVGIQEATMSFF
jgi:hypothetical protein